MLGGYKNMRSKVGPVQGLSALEPNNAKKSTFFSRFFTFWAHFSAILGPNGPKLGGNLGPASLKAPAHHGPLTQKKSANPRARAILAKNDPIFGVFWDFGGVPGLKHGLSAY